MYLTKEEEKMLDGEYGEAIAKAMRILVAVGEIYGAERMVEITSAHISGVSYKTIGDGGLEFLEDFSKSGAKVKVKTTLNPAGIDVIDWRRLDIADKEYVEKQKRIIEAYRRMGVEITLTCTPYYISNIPSFGDHIAWAESSAVIYANSVIGARTNREGAPSALAAAITGRTPYFGLHLDENRRAREKVVVKAELNDPAEFGALGIFVARQKARLPYFVFLKKVENLRVFVKYLGAALAAEGSIPMMHIEGFTPEWDRYDHEFEDTIEIEAKDLQEIFEESSCEASELIALGCPHLSPEELKMLLKYKPKGSVWLSIGLDIYQKHKDLVLELEKRGYLVAKGTCFVVSPIEKRYKITATNSGKAYRYLPSFCKQCTILRRTHELLQKS